MKRKMLVGSSIVLCCCILSTISWLFVQGETMYKTQLFDKSSQISVNKTAKSSWDTAFLNDNKSDYQKFIIGTWEGRWLENKISMYLTFQEDGKVIIDYSTYSDAYAKGKKFERSYKFVDEKTINISGYPNNFLIQKIQDDKFRFYSEQNEDEHFIEVIFICTFKKLNN